MAYFDRTGTDREKYYNYLNMVYEAQLPRRHQSWDDMSADVKKQWKKKVDAFEKALFNGDFDQY